MKPSSLLIVLSALLLNLFLWLWVNKPQQVVESAYPVGSFSFNPYQVDQSPFNHTRFSQEQIEDDLEILASKTSYLRIYSSVGGLEMIPTLAARHQMKVIASAYLDNRLPPASSIREFESLLGLAKRHENITHVLVGNETQLHKIFDRDELVRLLRRARLELKQPVSTAEPWDFWLQNTEMAEEVDFIAIHVLPYWAEIPVERAVDYVMEHYDMVKRTFPEKTVLIAETGWPSDGPQRGAAVPSVSNQALFIRDFISRAESWPVPQRKKPKTSSQLFTSFLNRLPQR